MCSERKMQANRLNAQKSTGPKTPEGKAKVSQNAVTHGLTSKRPVLEIEDTEEFRTFTTEMLNCLAPADPLEFFFAQRATCLAWRVQRAQSYETLILDSLINSKLDKTNPNDELGGTFKRSLSVGEEDRQDNLNSILGNVLLDDFRTHRTLEKISRYEARLESSMMKCFKQFENLRKNRKTNPMSYLGGTFKDVLSPRAEHPCGGPDAASVKTNPTSVAEASPLCNENDKTNPTNLCGTVALQSLDGCLAAENRTVSGKTKPNLNPITAQDGINLLKIPA